MFREKPYLKSTLTIQPNFKYFNGDKIIKS